MPSGILKLSKFVDITRVVDCLAIRRSDGGAVNDRPPVNVQAMPSSLDGSNLLI